ncbi:MAG: bifunctional phosphoglucose/phosphomannose isomerase [Firmicutes bacterium]|nr:bifunctional phosphoglucose/phosphomannose isomerase [Bacillota bacterium]
MIDLDSAQTLEALVKEPMAEYIYRLPEQIEEGWGITLPDLSGIKKPKNIVIAGMGGSAIGGDLLRVYAADSARIPIMVSRDYNLPAFVDEDSLVIGSSYSGNTEETLSAFQQAKERGASLIAISSNGKLRSLAQEWGIPFIQIPGGLPPRAALGYSLFPLLKVVSTLGVVEVDSAEVEATVKLLKELREELKPEVPSPKNGAKVVALALEGLIPLVYGSEPLLGPVAFRWKTQVNENAKSVIFNNTFPELDHNEINAWSAQPALSKKIGVVILRDQGESPQMKKRIDVTKKLMEDDVGAVVEVHSRGASKLERMLSLIYLGDYISLYLATIFEADPTPVEIIEKLKVELAK